MTVCDDEHITALRTWLAFSCFYILPVICMYAFDVRDDTVNPLRYVFYGFSLRTASILEDVPVLLISLMYFMRCDTFILAVVPFPD